MEKKKIIVAVSLIGMLGILITIFSVYHTMHMKGSYLQYPLFLYGTTIISLVIGGFIVYMFEEKINDRQIEKIVNILPRDERKIIRILIERKEIEQNKLGTLAGLNRVKLSRLISLLEERRVIEKKRHGHTNLIVFKV